MNEGPRLIVLDTNVVLDLFHFRDPAAQPLRMALASGQLRAAVTADIVDEWVRVLGYACFSLSAEEQLALRSQYQALCVFATEVRPVGVPRCADPDDQKFLELAAALGVTLVSKDRALLSLARRCASRFAIMTPAMMSRERAVRSDDRQADARRFAHSQHGGVRDPALD